MVRESLDLQITLLVGYFKKRNALLVYFKCFHEAVHNKWCLHKSVLLWLAKWCKIHKVYIHSHSMLLLIFTNIFIHIQQPNLHSRNVFIHIYLCISYSRLYLHTFTRCLYSHSTSYIHSHSRSKYSFNILCAPPLRSIKYGLQTTDYGLRTTDWV